MNEGQICKDNASEIFTSCLNKDLSLTSRDNTLTEYINGECASFQKSEKTKKRNIHDLKGHSSGSCKNPASVAKRNARERKRIQNVNKAFDELRQHVPMGSQNKISKVDTLQSAIEYIKALELLVTQKRGAGNFAGKENTTPDASDAMLSQQTRINFNLSGHHQNVAEFSQQSPTNTDDPCGSCTESHFEGNDWMHITDNITFANTQDGTNANTMRSVQVNSNADDQRLLSGFCDEYVVHNNDANANFNAMCQDDAEMANVTLEYQSREQMSSISFAAELENVYRIEAEFN